MADNSKSHWVDVNCAVKRTWFENPGLFAPLWLLRKTQTPHSELFRRAVRKAFDVHSAIVDVIFSEGLFSVPEVAERLTKDGHNLSDMYEASELKHNWFSLLLETSDDGVNIALLIFVYLFGSVEECGAYSIVAVSNPSFKQLLSAHYEHIVAKYSSPEAYVHYVFSVMMVEECEMEKIEMLGNYGLYRIPYVVGLVKRHWPTA